MVCCCDLLEVGVDSCLVLVRDLNTASYLVAVGHIVGCLPYAWLVDAKYLSQGLLSWCCLFFVAAIWVTHLLLLLALLFKLLSALKVIQ